MTDAPTPGRMTADLEREIQEAAAKWTGQSVTTWQKYGRALLAELDALRAERGGAEDWMRKLATDIALTYAHYEDKSTSAEDLASLVSIIARHAPDTAALQAENAALQAALKSMRDWVEHWRRDAEANMEPTLGSLDQAREEIDTALSTTSLDALTVVRQMREALKQALWHIGTDEDRRAMDQKDKWQTGMDECANWLRAALEAAARMFGKESA